MDKGTALEVLERVARAEHILLAAEGWEGCKDVLFIQCRSVSCILSKKALEALKND